tara:strand:+ start:3655 stop:4635 length:981 start_codon:yes stop_codon:yes gene_type:complete
MIYILLGNHWLINKKKQKLRSLNKIKKNDLKNFKAEDIIQDSFSSLKTVLNQSSMFGPGAWVETTHFTKIINAVNKKGNAGLKNKLNIILENKPEGFWVISEEEENYENNSNIRKKITNFLNSIQNKNIKIFLEEIPRNFKNQPDMEQYTKDLLLSTQYKFSTTIAKKIINQSGNEISSIDQSVQTLKMLAHETKHIKDEMVKFLPRNNQSTVFKIIDLIIDKKTLESKNLIMDLKKSGEEPIKILGWMVQEWKRLAIAKNGNNDFLKKDLGPTMAWKAKILVARAKKIPEKKIIHGFQFLTKADLDLKTSDINPWIIIDSLIYNL